MRQMSGMAALAKGQNGGSSQALRAGSHTDRADAPIGLEECCLRRLVREEGADLPVFILTLTDHAPLGA
jgi:hypothetical protein